MKPATLVETGVGSAGECGLTEGTVETGTTAEVAGHVARIGVHLKVLQEERVFLASGILGCSGNRFSARLCERDGGERRTREREAIAFCEPTHTTLGVLGTEDTAGRSPTGFVPWT